MHGHCRFQQVSRHVTASFYCNPVIIDNECKETTEDSKRRNWYIESLHDKGHGTYNNANKNKSTTSKSEVFE